LANTSASSRKVVPVNRFIADFTQRKNNA